jgi:hypothetical protein
MVGLKKLPKKVIKFEPYHFRGEMQALVNKSIADCKADIGHLPEMEELINWLVKRR